eukprot:10863987-Prorocentrum_lima.AAC.1
MALCHSGRHHVDAYHVRPCSVYAPDVVCCNQSEAMLQNTFGSLLRADCVVACARNALTGKPLRWMMLDILSSTLATS